MSAPLPVQVDALRFAKQGRQLAGYLDLGQMGRLGQYLCSSGGQVEVSLEFGVDAVGTAFLRGVAKADLEMLCQRCLEPMHQTVVARFSLGLVGSEAQGERLAGDYEPLMVDDDDRIFLSDVIEDELILALPIVSMHDGDECTAATKAASRDTVAAEPAAKENPFAVLKDLKH